MNVTRTLLLSALALGAFVAAAPASSAGPYCQWDLEDIEFYGLDAGVVEVRPFALRFVDGWPCTVQLECDGNPTPPYRCRLIVIEPLA